MKNALSSTIRSAMGTSILLFCFSASPVFAESPGVAGVVGSKIADFSFKVSSVTYLDDRNVLNMQSTADVGRFGTVGVTGTFMKPIDAQGTTGQYMANATAFRPDGVLMSAKIQGAWKALGKHRWQVKTIGVNTEGKSTFSVGVVELATMSFNGSVYNLD